MQNAHHFLFLFQQLRITGNRPHETLTKIRDPPDAEEKGMLVFLLPYMFFGKHVLLENSRSVSKRRLFRWPRNRVYKLDKDLFLL